MFLCWWFCQSRTKKESPLSYYFQTVANSSFLGIFSILLCVFKTLLWTHVRAKDCSIQWVKYACEMSDHYVSYVLVHLTGGVELPVAVTFSLWLLRISHSVCVSAWWMTPAPVEQSLPGALLFFFLTFAWEQNCVHSRAKTNSDNHLICNDVWSSLSGRQVIRRPGMSGQHSGGNTNATTQATCWVCPIDLLHHPHDLRVTSLQLNTDDAALFSFFFQAPCFIVSAIWSSDPITRNKSQIPWLLNSAYDVSSDQ